MEFRTPLRCPQASPTEAPVYSADATFRCGQALIYAEAQARRPLAPDRDLVLVDQRATGDSEPDLCPDLDRALVAAVAIDRETEAKRQTLCAACHDQAVKRGIDLTDFGTTVTVDALDSVRQALGIARWKLFGVSYGTTVVMTMMALHPETRSDPRSSIRSTRPTRSSLPGRAMSMTPAEPSSPRAIVTRPADRPSQTLLAPIAMYEFSSGLPDPPWTKLEIDPPQVDARRSNLFLFNISANWTYDLMGGGRGDLDEDASAVALSWQPVHEGEQHTGHHESHVDANTPAEYTIGEVSGIHEALKQLDG